MAIPPPTLNPDAPLNAGLLARFIAHPEYDGTANWRDLSGNGHDASLVGSLGDNTPRAAWWSLSKPPGGYYSLNSNQNEPGLALAAPIQVQAESDFTFAVWIRRTAVGKTSNNPSELIGGRGTVGEAIYLSIAGLERSPDNGYWPSIRWGAATLLAPTEGYTPITDLETWTRFVFVVESGDSARFYANGVLKHSAAITFTTTAATIYDIRRNITGDNPSGLMADFTIASVAWSDQMVADDYQELLDGYPTVLKSPDTGPLFQSPSLTNHFDRSQLFHSPHLVGSLS